MIKGIAKNFSRPRGLFGSLVINGMNKGHEKLTRWALEHVDIQRESTVLDIGCGGGNAVRMMAERSDHVYGVDYSEVSVKKSRQMNADAIAQGRVVISQASVSQLPFQDGMFDVATAFETIYFWPDLAQDFAEVWRVLKPGGVFMPVYQTGTDAERTQKVQQSIPNMKVPDVEHVQQWMRDAGFAEITLYETGNDTWRDMCITGVKP